VSVLPISSFNEFCWAFLFVGLAYYATYFIFGAILFYTNPFPRTEQRIKNTKKEAMLGISALFFVILYTVIWLWKIDPLTPYYGYWGGRENEFTLFETVKQIAIYMVVFDAWFYATHHLLHIDWFMRNVHSWHHVPYNFNAAIL
jgi:lathosterol oxidase